jgi:hypothetical protein
VGEIKESHIGRSVLEKRSEGKHFFERVLFLLWGFGI